MSKFFKIFVILLLFIFLKSEFLYSQTSRKFNNPFLVIDVNTSLGVPLLDLNGSDLSGVWNFSDYGMSTGFGMDVNFRFNVKKLKQTEIRPYFSLSYVHFTNDDSKSYIEDGAILPPWPSKGFNGEGAYLPSDTAGTSRFRIYAPSIALGLEYLFYTSKNQNFSIGVGLDFNINVILGLYQETYADTVDIYPPGVPVEFAMKPNTRLGLGSNVIANYRLSNALGINFGMRFQLPNLFGKDSQVSDERNTFYLLDEGNTSISSYLSNNRTIGYFKFFAGMSFFLGKM